MRKILPLLFIGISGIATAQSANVQNADFENWSINDSAVVLDSWFWTAGQGTAELTADAQNGSKAVKLTNLDDGQGGINNGLLALGDFSQGFSGYPYTSLVDSVIFYAKYNIPAGDSASVIVLQMYQGNPIPSIKTIGGSSATYQRMGVELLSPFQDSIIIIFSSGDLFGGTPSQLGTTITIDNVSAKGLFPGAALPNNSFETSTTTYIEEPDNFVTTTAVSQSFGFDATVEKTTDAQNGTYAAFLKAVFVGQGNVPGAISNALDANLNATNGVPYTDMPDSLTGWVKYTATAGDQGYVYVSFTKNGNMVAEGSFLLDADINTYEKFNIPFTFTDQPDSMAITIYSGDETTSELTIDNLMFGGNQVGLDEVASIQASIYPNPTADFVTVSSTSKLDKIQVLDLNGSVVKEMTPNSVISFINLSDLNAGVYMIQLVAGEAKTVSRVVKK